VPWHLIALAIQTHPDQSDPVDDISRALTQDMEDLYESWAGRWILIGNGELHLDAAGTLGCYYLEAIATKEDCPVWISSSIALLCELAGDYVGRKDPRELRWNQGIDWFPLPGSRFSLMRKLLPSQVLRLVDGSVRPRRLIRHVDHTLSYAQILEGMEAALVTFMKRIHKRRRRVWLGLTGGLDSRLLLAAASKARIPIRTYTQEYRALPYGGGRRASLSLADRLLPKQLAAAVGLDHVLIRAGRFDEEKAALFDAHCARSSLEAGARHYYASGQYEFGDPGDIILTGNCIPVGRCAYWRRFADIHVPDAEKLAAVFGERGDSRTALLLDEWIKWADQSPQPGLDWRDRFEIEQREAGWVSDSVQAMELAEKQFCFPFNCSSFFALSLLVAPEKRGPGQHQRDLIRHMAPQLLEAPTNPDDAYFPALTRLYWHWRDDPLYPVTWAKLRYSRVFHRSKIMRAEVIKTS